MMDEVKDAYKELEETHKALEVSHTKLKTVEFNLNREMEAAHTIQNALLPRDLSHNEFDMDARMLTAIAVGGDYYDFIHTGSKDWFAIGDVSGHGVHAGLIMMMVQTSLHLLLREKPDISLIDMLAGINVVIANNIQRLGDPRFMTFMLLRHEGDGCFTYCGMHLPPLIYRKQSKQVEEIPTHGIWLGLLDSIEGLNQEAAFKMESGDCLLLYTDGLTEAESMDTIFHMYGDKHLSELFCKHGDKPAHAITEAIISDLIGYRIVDDVTLFVIKRL